MTESNQQIMAEIKESVTALHAVPEEELYAKFGTSPDGLGVAEILERQNKYGRNILPIRKPPTLAGIFLHQFLSPLIYILLGAGVVSIIIGETTDAVFIFAVILLNAALGTFQEWKAEKSAAALQNLLRTHTRVMRNKHEHEIYADELVPGDIVFLESGNKVPADLRLVDAINVHIDESLLTGESLTVEKHVATLARDIPVVERVNMAFAGSTVMSGRAIGIVAATGLHTEVGKIAKSVAFSEATKPPLVIRMEHFARQVSLIVMGASVLLAIVASAKGIPYTEVFFLAVALAVSAIPEGLPVAMTVALSIATKRMANRNVIVRKLTAVESLGSCTLIASDKTGTLTVNKQTVKMIALPTRGEFTVSGEGYAGEGTVSGAAKDTLSEEDNYQLKSLARAVILCNEASLFKEEDQWKFHGDAVDVALLAFGYKMGLEAEEIKQRFISVGQIPFESERRYAAEFYREDGHVYSAVKGAVETLLPFCQTMLNGHDIVPIDPGLIGEKADFLAANGYRVIAVAQGQAIVRDRQNYNEADLASLTLIGLIGLIDPLRPEVKESVNNCRRAGVDVVMITGDHPSTALAIARDLGIATSEEDVVTGKELDRFESPEIPEFLEIVKRVHVFARVTPLQKLYIVEALQNLGHFVAVTGDGVNDAPALRKANIGIAMGSGTDVAKDNASLLVTDDNFASIEAGIEEGRFAYDNIRKVIYLLISTGAAEVVLFTLAVFSGLPLPLLAVQLLWLNLVTNGIQDVALAFEAGEPGAMDKPPRKPAEGIFNKLMIQQTIASGIVIGLISYFTWYWLLNAGWEETAARNMILLLMVLLENFHVFNARSETVSAFKIPVHKNIILVGGVVVAQLIHILSMHLPFMQRVLNVSPVTFREWFSLILLASTILFAMEIFKFFKFRSDFTEGRL